jgi:hypothetical protein
MQTVTYPMPKSTGEYLTSVLGAAEGNPQLVKLIEAAHHVLAGGSADVTITAMGDASRVTALNTLRDTAMLRSNELNGAAGTYVSLEP